MTHEPSLSAGAIETERRLATLEAGLAHVPGVVQGEIRALRVDLVALAHTLTDGLEGMNKRLDISNGRVLKSEQRIDSLADAEHDAGIRLEERRIIGAVVTRKQVAIGLALIVAAGGIAANISRLVEALWQ